MERQQQSESIEDIQEKFKQWRLARFRNKLGTALKILICDGQGFWLCQKRLSKGRFKWWPKNAHDESYQLAAHELQMLIWNGNPQKTMYFYGKKSRH